MGVCEGFFNQAPWFFFTDFRFCRTEGGENVAVLMGDGVNIGAPSAENTRL